MSRSSLVRPLVAGVALTGVVLMVAFCGAESQGHAKALSQPLGAPAPVSHASALAERIGELSVGALLAALAVGAGLLVS